MRRAELAVFIEETIRRWGLDVVRNANAVQIEVRGWGAGPTLALASHLDVVPPGAGWTRDPFTPIIEGTRLYGRGSGDAKASVAAMLYAAKDIVDSGGMDAGRLLVILGYGEETKNTTMGAAVEAAGEIDAAVIGEPTSLDLAVAQRGLMMVDLLAQGDQRHAAYASGEDGFTNSVQVLARDLLKLGFPVCRTHRIRCSAGLRPPRPCWRPGSAGTSPLRLPGPYWMSAARPTGPTRSLPRSCGPR